MNIPSAAADETPSIRRTTRRESVVIPDDTCQAAKRGGRMIKFD
jgi:hypothetical protein